jgi:aldose 1-epimerase
METYTPPSAAGFDREIDGAQVGLYTISSQDGSCHCAITNYGARVVSLLVPDVKNVPTDIVLGYPALDGYLLQPEEYMGSIVGRCANRIAAGLFVLNGQTCILPTNDGPNTLHGGPRGFHARVWQVLNVSDTMLELGYSSADEEEGFPGNVDVRLTYQWTKEHMLQMHYRATTDKATLVNLSNHSYFNLSGEGAETILDHILKVDAHAITPVNDTLIPTGMLMDVSGTPFDFRDARPLAHAIDHQHEQLIVGKGYDHNFVLSKGSNAVTLCSPRSGIQMSINTDRPGMQIYSGNFLDGSRKGKSGKPYLHRSAIALEPQSFPDAIHHPQFPSVVLKPGTVYYSLSEYQFSTIETQ